MNCDVPYLAACSGNQKLASARDVNAMGLPEGQVQFQQLEFGLFQGDFPPKLMLRLRDNDGVPVFLEKIVISKVSCRLLRRHSVRSLAWLFVMKWRQPFSSWHKHSSNIDSAGGQGELCGGG